jgi:hypothetical protein
VNLNETELLELIAEGEGRSMEFKRGLPRDEKLARTLCAFANTRGGLLFIGVNDNRSLYGVSQPRKALADIFRVAQEFLEPPLRVQGTIVPCQGLVVVTIQVPVSVNRPHKVVHKSGDDEIVVRIGSSNRVAKGATLDALRNGTTRARSRGSLEAQILAWVDARTRLSPTPGGDASPAFFSKDKNVGAQRARRAFVRLERDGLLVGHGKGTQRIYCRP